MMAIRRSGFTSIPRRALLRRSAALAVVAATAWSGGRVHVSRAAAGTSIAQEIPDTAAGRKLGQWLAALNAGDVDALLAYYGSIAADEGADFRATFDLINRRSWGRVEVYSVLESDEQRVAALLTTDLSEEWLQIAIDVGRSPAGMELRPGTPPQTAGEGPLSEEEIGREVERYLGKLAAADAFSGVVLLARDGAPFFTAAHGRANQATDQPNRLSTRFNLGSMNKMMTAVSIAQLAEQGRLAFTDTLDRLLPDYPNREAAERITVHQLLTHTSGLGDFFGPRYMREKDHIRAPRDYLPMFVDEPLRFEPGSDWSYSNAGFIVLGAIVEQVSGWDYFDYVRAHIYRTAGMARSGSFERDAAVPDLAIGYGLPLPADRRDLRPEVALQPRTDNSASLGIKGSPAGGGYATVEDLLGFARALLDQRLLSPAATEVVLTGKVDALGPMERYAYGFTESVANGVRIVGHGGGAPGISANLDMFLGRDGNRDSGGDRTGVVLANYDQIAQPVARKIRWLLTQG